MVSVSRVATAAIEPRVLAIFREELELEVDAETPLIDAGILDSVGFVRLLAELERVFGVQVELAELELDDFHCISKIARLVESLREVVE
jgi:acyl carrier protein